LSDLVNGTKRAHSSYGVFWSDTEAHASFKKMLFWWDTDKHYLLEKETPNKVMNIPEEFRSRFLHLLKVLNGILAPSGFWRNDKPVRDTLIRLINEMSDHGLPTVNLKFSYIELFPGFERDLIGYINGHLASNDPEIATDVYNMIDNLTLNPHTRNALGSKVSQLFNLVAQQIKWRNYPILNTALNTFRMAIINCPDELDDAQLEAVEFGLEHLLSETKGNSKMPLDERLVFRNSSARIAYKLYQFYNERTLNIPSTILDWKKTMSSDEEFDDIRKEWLN
jgi:hypothetical protein